MVTEMGEEGQRELYEIHNREVVCLVVLSMYHTAVWHLFYIVRIYGTLQKILCTFLVSLREQFGKGESQGSFTYLTKMLW